MSHTKEENLEIVKWVIDQHNRIMNQEINEYLSSSNKESLVQAVPLNIDKIEERCRCNLENLKKKKSLYINKLEELGELMLALNDERLELSSSVRLQCLEYHYTESSMINDDLISLLHMIN